MSDQTRLASAVRPMHQLVCPYCVRFIDWSALRYKCPVQGDKPCLQEFAGDGRTAGAECPNGHGLSYLAMCPHPDCRNTLPPRYLEAPSYFIGLIGPTNSGKSTYLAILVRQLQRYMDEGLDITFVAADEWTSDRYEERYEPLVTRHRLVNPTQSAERDPGTARPLIYVLTVGQTRSRIWGRSRRRSINLVFFDSAGEDVRLFARMQRYLRYLRHAAGVVFLIDPLTLPDAAPDLVNVPAAEAWHNAAVARRVITNTTDQLRIAYHVPREAKKVPVPVAVAISKVDELQPSLIDNSPLTRGPARRDGLDINDRTDVHEYVRGLLHRWEWPLDNYLEDNYSSYALFGFSALGAPVEDNAIAAGGLRPYRVLDPMFWFLSKFGLIAGVGGGR